MRSITKYRGLFIIYKALLIHMVPFNVHNHPESQYKWPCYFIDRKPRLKGWGSKREARALTCPFRKCCKNYIPLNTQIFSVVWWILTDTYTCVTITQKGYRTFHHPGSSPMLFPSKASTMFWLLCALKLSLTLNSIFHILFSFCYTIPGFEVNSVGTRGPSLQGRLESMQAGL